MTRKAALTLSFLASGWAVARTAAADVVFLNGGDEVSGRVAAVTAAAVSLQEKAGTRQIPKGDIQKIKLVKEWRVPGEDRASAIKDPVVRAALARPPKPEAYPDDGYYVVLDERTYVLNKDGSFSKTVRSVRSVLRERGKNEAGNVRIPYLGGLERVELGWARAVGGSDVYYLDDTSVQDASEHYYYPPYDRLRSLKFSVPNVDIGSLVDYSYTVASSSAGRARPFYGEMFFRRYEPMAVARLKVVVPKGVRLRHAESGLPGTATFRETTAGGETRYVWEVRDVPSFREEDNSPPFARMAPRVSFCVEDDWGAVRKELADAAAAAAAPSPELKAKTAELAAAVPAGPDGRRDPLSVAQALYGWVAREIKYAGIGMDDYSYLPKPAAEVLATKIGDSLDKPFLLYAMLREAGLGAAFVYVKDKGESPFMSDLPSVRQFTTGAVLAELGGRTLLLAPLTDSRRMDELPGELQEVRGLRLDGGGDMFLETPLRDESAESAAEKTVMTLDADGSARVETEQAFRGADQSSYRALKDIKREEVRKWVEQVVHGVHPNARLLDYSLDGADDLTRDMRLAYTYRIPDYALKAGGKFLVFKVPGLEYPAADVGRPSRELPLFWEQRHRLSHEVSIRLPSGFRVYHLPAEARLEDETGSYRAEYSSKAGLVGFSDALTRRATGIPPEGYARYKSFREGVAKFGENWLVITR